MARVERLREQLAGTFEAGKVDDFTIDGTYGGRDEHDAHVHAAAVACRADVLVTADRNGFTWDENASPYEVMHPDDFLVLVDGSSPGLVAEVVSRMCAYWVGRDGHADLPGELRDAGCPAFAERVRVHLQNQL